MPMLPHPARFDLVAQTAPNRLVLGSLQAGSHLEADPSRLVAVDWEVVARELGLAEPALLHLPLPRSPNQNDLPSYRFDW